MAAGAIVVDSACEQLKNLLNKDSFSFDEAFSLIGLEKSVESVRNARKNIGNVPQQGQLDDILVICEKIFREREEQEALKKLLAKSEENSKKLEKEVENSLKGASFTGALSILVSLKEKKELKKEVKEQKVPKTWADQVSAAQELPVTTKVQVTPKKQKKQEEPEEMDFIDKILRGAELVLRKDDTSRFSIKYINVNGVKYSTEEEYKEFPVEYYYTLYSLCYKYYELTMNLDMKLPKLDSHSQEIFDKFEARLMEHLDENPNLYDDLPTKANVPNYIMPSDRNPNPRPFSLDFQFKELFNTASKEPSFYKIPLIESRPNREGKVEKGLESIVFSAFTRQIFVMLNMQYNTTN